MTATKQPSICDHCDGDSPDCGWCAGVTITPSLPKDESAPKQPSPEELFAIETEAKRKAKDIHPPTSFYAAHMRRLALFEAGREAWRAEAGCDRALAASRHVEINALRGAIIEVREFLAEAAESPTCGLLDEDGEPTFEDFVALSEVDAAIGRIDEVCKRLGILNVEPNEDSK